MSNPYFLAATISLTVQITVLCLIVLGYYMRRKNKFRQHGTIMTASLLVHLITIFSIMIPSFVGAVIPQHLFINPLEIISIVGLIHGILGLTVAALGVWFVGTWRFKSDLSVCFKKKRPMRFAIAIWITTLTLGIILYYLFYTAV